MTWGGSEPRPVPEPEPDSEEEPEPEPEPTSGAARRRREQVFGDVLPEGTRDDRTESEGERGAAGPDEWLRREVPPHHG